jgi:hypothetical protein
MALFAILCHIAPAALIGVFSNDLGRSDTARSTCASFLELRGLGLIFVTSSMFQAMGNLPSLVSSAVRITLTAVPAVCCHAHPAFSSTGSGTSRETTFVQLG